MVGRGICMQIYSRSASEFEVKGDWQNCSLEEFPQKLRAKVLPVLFKAEAAMRSAM